MSPFVALYGYHHPSTTSPLKMTIKAQAMVDNTWLQQDVLKLLKDNMVIAQNTMKQQLDQHRSERKFEVGNWVRVRLQPYK